MKSRVIFIICITIIFNNGVGQSNEKAFADTTLWHMFSYFSWVGGPSGGPQYEYFHTYNMIISDTIIDSITYQKLYSCNSGFETNNLAQIGYFMKNENKVYFGESIDSMEIMYDYTLNVGDSFEFKGLNNPYPAIYNVVVNEVDSILFNNSIRKRIHFDDFPYAGSIETIAVTWTEGIGDYNYGLVFDYGLILFCESLGNSYISCYNENNIPIIGDCQVNLSIPSIGMKQYLSVFPNPFTEYIIITGSGDKLIQIDLLNIRGQLLESRKERINTRLDYSSIKPGIYILSIEYNNQLFFKKLIKN